MLVVVLVDIVVVIIISFSIPSSPLLSSLCYHLFLSLFVIGVIDVGVIDVGVIIINCRHPWL